VKWVRRILLVLLALIVVAIVVINMYFNRILKTAIETVGPDILGVPVTVEEISVRYFRGLVRVKGLVVGNPEGFKGPFLFRMGKLEVDVDMSTLASDEVIVNKVHVIAPQVFYEKSLKTSNIGRLLDNLEPEEDVEEEEERGEEERDETVKEEEEKKVIIEDFVLDDGTISVAMTLSAGHGLKIPLPGVHKTDVGKDKEGGTSLRDIIVMFFKFIGEAVVNAVSGSVELIGDGVEAVGDAAADGAKAVGGAAADGAKAVGDGAQKVGTATVDGAKKAGSAVKDGAGKLIDGATGVFKRDD